MNSALADIIAAVLFIVDEVLEKFFTTLSPTAGAINTAVVAGQCNGFYNVVPNACGQLLIDNIATATSAIAGLAGPIFQALGTVS